MADQPRARVVVQNWKGQDSSSSPHASDPESCRLMENIGVFRNGAADTRAGLTVARYDN